MLTGLHHTTAVARDAQRNLDFYAGLLGLRLVKVNVNQDDPTSLHFYYGDARGSPGSLVTFFIVPGLRRGQAGWPQVGSVRLVVPRVELDALRARLVSANRLAADAAEVSVMDDDGLRVDVRAGDEATVRLDRQTAFVRDRGPTLDFCRRVFGGFDVERVLNLEAADAPRGRPGAGTVHHLAFRVPDEAAHAELRARLAAEGVDASERIDRFYFTSVYFREPGGVLFEVATDGPGFAVDEPADALGRKLTLPPWLEPHRAEIERAVPRFEFPVT